MKRCKRDRAADIRRLSRRKVLRKDVGDVTELTRKKTVGIGLLNINGVSVQSVQDIKRIVQVEELEILCLTETHVRKEDKHGVSIPGFDSHESLREGNEKKGGGLAILTRKGGIVYTRYRPKIASLDLEYVSRERLWVTYASEQSKTAVCVVYLACANKDRSHVPWNKGILKVVSEEVYQLRGKGYRIAIHGDFNAWVGDDLSQGGIPGNKHKTTGNGVVFKDFLVANSLIHLNGACRVPGDWNTRVSKGLWTRHAPDHSSSSVLDYAVVSSEHLDSVVEFVVDQQGVMGGDSDHNLVVTRLRDKFVTSNRVAPPVTKEGWNIKEDQDWGKFKEVVAAAVTSLGDTMKQASVQRMSDTVVSILTKGLEEGVGRRVTVATGAKKEYPANIVKLLKESRVLREVWKTRKVEFANSHSPVPPDSLMIAAQYMDEKRKEVDEAIIRFKRQVRAPIKKLCKMKSRRGLKTFWKYVSRIPASRAEITTLQNKRTGVLHSDPEEVLEEVTQYLKTIFSGSDDQGGVEGEQPVESGVEDLGNVKHDHCYNQEIPRGAEMPGHEYCSSSRPQLSSVDSSSKPKSDPAGFLDKDFSHKEVREMISSLGNGKAAGHDGIPNEALKNAPAEMVSLVTALYNKVKNKGSVPVEWKRGRLVLIHKKGPKTDVFNYRPLTVLQSVSGLYTKLLNKRLSDVAEAHNLLGEIQNGFRKGRAGGDSAFVLNTVLWKMSAQQKAVHLAFLDLMKAYDTVDRPTL